MNSIITRAAINFSLCRIEIRNEIVSITGLDCKIENCNGIKTVSVVVNLVVTITAVNLNVVAAIRNFVVAA